MTDSVPVTDVQELQNYIIKERKKLRQDAIDADEQIIFDLLNKIARLLEELIRQARGDDVVSLEDRIEELERAIED